MLNDVFMVGDGDAINGIPRAHDQAFELVNEIDITGFIGLCREHDVRGLRVIL